MCSVPFRNLKEQEKVKPSGQKGFVWLSICIYNLLSVFTIYCLYLQSKLRGNNKIFVFIFKELKMRLEHKIRGDMQQIISVPFCSDFMDRESLPQTALYTNYCYGLLSRTRQWKFPDPAITELPAF